MVLWLEVGAILKGDCGDGIEEVSSESRGLPPNARMGSIQVKF